MDIKTGSKLIEYHEAIIKRGQSCHYKDSIIIILVPHKHTKGPAAPNNTSNCGDKQRRCPAGWRRGVGSAARYIRNDAFKDPLEI